MDFKLNYKEKIEIDAIDLPGSKSITNRVLLINEMSETKSRIDGIAQCDDTYAITDGLRNMELGNVNVGAAGTAMRFLTAFFAATPGSELILTGTDRMLNRPIGPLVEALQKLGANIEYVSEEGFPPLKIKGRCLEGGHIGVRSDISSQFISALMIIGPTLQKGLTIHLLEDTISKTYIEMTNEIMRKFGINSHFNKETINIPHQSYLPPMTFSIEADWSGASYFYEIAAIASIKKMKLKGLLPPKKSLQGDSRLAEIYELFGVHTVFADGYAEITHSEEKVSSGRIELSLTDCPDLVPAIAVTACLCEREFNLTGIANLRIKECDRLHALVVELRRLGYFLRCDSNSLSWDGERCEPDLVPEIRTYKDHRIAMAFAPVGVRFPSVVIRDVGVVQKSFPQFWSEMRAVGLETTAF